jgi:hypothetical protein
MTEKVKCQARGCGKVVDPSDVCPDGYCRECHVSLGFEECCDGSWGERLRASYGLSRQS